MTVFAMNVRLEILGIVVGEWGMQDVRKL